LEQNLKKTFSNEKQNKTPKLKFVYIPIIFTLLFGSAMIGLTDYIMAGFSFEEIFTPSFWMNIITTNAGTLSIIISILLIKNDQYKENDKDYLQVVNGIAAFRTTKFIPLIFEKFINSINIKYKKAAFKKKIMKKYDHLKSTPKRLHIYLSGTDEQKRKSRYCKRRDYFEELLSTDYINKSIENIKIKYNTISEKLIFSGIPTTSEDEDYIIKNKAVKVATDLLPKYLLTFAISVLTASIVIDWADGITASVLLKTFSKLFTIIMQINFSLNYSKRYSIEVILHDALFRDSIIKRYDTWVDKEFNKIQTKQPEVPKEKEQNFIKEEIPPTVFIPSETVPMVISNVKEV
jgi:hypothetical protein